MKTCTECGSTVTTETGHCHSCRELSRIGKVPSLQEIRAAVLEIQSRWTARQEYNHRACHQPRVEVTVVHVDRSRVDRREYLED